MASKKLIPDQSWFDTIDQEEAASLTSQLVAIRSCPGEEGPVQRFVADWLTKAGLSVELQPTEGDRPNVIARCENGAGKIMMLNGHIDTVLAAAEWEHDPWTPRREGDKLFGLGACDMKSGVAAIMLAARELVRHKELWQGTLIVTTVGDEEAYSLGARHLLNGKLAADFCIVTESSWMRPIIGGVGKVLLRIEAKGRACHGSWPANGINAAVEAAKLVAKIDSLPMASHEHLTPTQCVLDFHSGSERYVITVPENACFRINRHTVPGEIDADIIESILELANSLDSPAKFAVTIDPPYYPPWEIEGAHALPTAFAAAYESETGTAPNFGYNQGVADTNLFAAAGIATIQFGPHGDKYHAAGEWVDVRTIPATVRILLKTIGTLLPRN